MFGYVRCSKLDLTIRDFIKYKAYYCGVCKAIKINFGQINRCFLNYDIVFMAILLSALYENEQEYSYERCYLSSLKKKKIISNKYVEYSAGMNILFVYYKMKDDYKDKRSAIAYIGMKFLNNKYIKCRNMYLDKEEILRCGIEKIQKLESDGCSSIIEMANAFGEVLSEMFIYSEEHKQVSILREIGFDIGRYIYILDSYDDLEKDIDKEQFNSLKNLKNVDIRLEVSKLINEILERLSINVERLEIRQSKEIIYNIVKFGLRNKADSILKKRRQLT